MANSLALLESLSQRCSSVSHSHIKQLHAQLLSSGNLRSSPSAATLSRLSAASDLSYAFRLLRSLPAAADHDDADTPPVNLWNDLIRGLARGPHPAGALLCLRAVGRARLRPDALSCSFALQACARALAAFEARQVHALVVGLGFGADCRLMTTLLDAYAKVGKVECARKVFDEMGERDVAAWNALILGLAQGNLPGEALGLFWRMREEVGLWPNGVTVIGALSACAQMGAVNEGEEVHRYVVEAELDEDVVVCNSVIDMYAKCGFVEKAYGVFCGMRCRKCLVTWNTMIMAFAFNGEAQKALDLFGEMAGSGVQPDGVSYLGALCACNHAGLVNEGVRLFDSMVGLGLVPNVKHYGSVVDLLGRAGRLQEAYEIVNSMTVVPDAVLWLCLLGASKTYGNVEMAEIASNKIMEMGSSSCGDFVLLSNVYAAYGRWDDVRRVREAMKEKDVKKIPGFSYTEVDGVVHKFVNGDQSHEKWREIYAKLDEIRFGLNAYGYVEKTNIVLHDIGEEDKENALYYHSEKLALAFGLISTSEGNPIQVIKNLRICEDCHEVFKLVSKIFDREIIVRDRARFHRFKDGLCSCQDYW